MGECIHNFRAYIREIVKLMVPDDLGYVSQLSNVIFDRRVCLSKMVEDAVCDASAAATANAEIKNTWITPPLPLFLCSIVRNSAMRQVKF
jgi:hypothetical protein